MSSPLVIGVDFDGTIVRHAYPDIGDPIPGAIETLRECVRRRALLVLFTMRSGHTLDEAVAFMAEHRVELYGVNRNPTQDTWTCSPKAYCHVYVDDAALGCPLVQEGDEFVGLRPMVDWSRVAPVLYRMIETRDPSVW